MYRSKINRSKINRSKINVVKLTVVKSINTLLIYDVMHYINYLIFYALRNIYININ
jgi:hypothetical protein